MAYYYRVENDKVKLAYYKISYTEYKAAVVRYASTIAERDAIILALSQRGIAATSSAILQTGNEWIEGLSFTNHDDIPKALAAGNKSFICSNDTAEIANTVMANNDSTFSVGADFIWDITIPTIPALPCYTVIACVTVPSLGNQRIRINNGPIKTLMHGSLPVMASSITGTVAQPSMVQLNVIKDSSYVFVATTEPLYNRYPSTATFNDGVVVHGSFYAYNHMQLGNGPSDRMTVGATSVFSEAATFNGIAVFNRPATFTSASTATFSASATFNSTAIFNGSPTFTKPVTFNDNVTVGTSGSTTTLTAYNLKALFKTEAGLLTAQSLVTTGTPPPSLACARNTYAGTTDMVAGTTALAEGAIYFVYE